MAFDIFLLAFDKGEPCPIDARVARDILEPVATEQDGGFLRIEVGDGTADVFGLGEDDDQKSSLMFNHVSGIDPWATIFQVMEACQLAVIAPGSETCVSSAEIGARLPSEFVEWTIVSSGDELLVALTGEPNTAMHREPAWRDRANYILRIDLEPHGMPDRFEQLWVRQIDPERFELCCIPFFIYGAALGDIVTTEGNPGVLTVIEPSRHRCLRIAIKRPPADDTTHVSLHRALVDADATFEFYQAGYVSVDIASDEQSAVVLNAIQSFIDTGEAVWEWAER